MIDERPIDGVRTVIATLPDFGIGGGQTILLRTLAALRDLEDRIVVVVVGLRGGPMRDRFEEAGIRTEVLELAGVTGMPAAALALVHLARRERATMLLSLNTPLDRCYAQLAGTMLGVPVAIWFMSVAIPRLPFPPPRGRELAFAKRLLLYPSNWVSVRRAEVLIGLSRSVSRSFADHLGLDVERFEHVPPGLPDEFYRSRLDASERATLRSSVGACDDGPLLLCVGMLIDLKGQAHLVEMMDLLRHRLPNARLALVGDGPDRPQLEARIEVLGLGERVRLLGHRHDVPELLEASDGLLSASRSEGFGMAVLEAMAAGKPVVAVHTPAFDEFALADVTARFVPEQDASLLADAVEEVFADRSGAAAMGTAARGRAEAFRVERTAAEIGRIITQLVDAPGTTAVAVQRV